MKLYERISRRPPAAAGTALERRDNALQFQDWVNYFSYNGLTYGGMQTSMNTISEESVARTVAQAYESNGPVFALVLARQQVFSQVRFQWTRFKGSQHGDLFGTPELGVLERPWPNGTTSDLLARMELDASTAGNAYVRRTRQDRLNVLPPQWVTIILGSHEEPDDAALAGDVEVIGYMYAPPGLDPLFLLPNEVAHYAPLPDPMFHFLGMSWITPVIRELQGDSLSTEHKARFFQNAATPNLAIKFDPRVTKDQIQAFKELMDDGHIGAANAYRTLYLGGGADATVIGKDFKELDFSATQGKGESRLAAAAGVPPSWVGFSEGLQGSALNAGNFNSARRRFSDGTMVHLWTNACSSLQAILRPPDPNVSLWFDSRIPFMREDAKDGAQIQQMESTTITALVRDGFTPESAVAAVMNNDWTLLVHTGLTSVQLLPPSNGTEPYDPNAPTPPPPADTGNGTGAGAS